MDDRLYRSRDERMIAGVAGGLAERLDLDPSLVRIIWAVLVLPTGFLALLVYVVMAIVVPGAERDAPPEAAAAATGPSSSAPSSSSWAPSSSSASSCPTSTSTSSGRSRPSCSGPPSSSPPSSPRESRPGAGVCRHEAGLMSPEAQRRRAVGHQRKEPSDVGRERAGPLRDAT